MTNQGPCPLYPEFEIIEKELSDQVPKRVKAITLKNMIALDKYAQRLEVRAGCKTP